MVVVLSVVVVTVVGGTVVVLLVLGVSTVVEETVLEATTNSSLDSDGPKDDVSKVIFGALIVTTSGVKRAGNSVLRKDGKKVGVVTSALGGGTTVTVGVFVRRETTVVAVGLVIRDVVVVADVGVVEAGVVVVVSVAVVVVEVAALVAVLTELVERGAEVLSGALVKGAFLVTGTSPVTETAKLLCVVGNCFIVVDSTEFSVLPGLDCNTLKKLDRGNREILLAVVSYLC